MKWAWLLAVILAALVVIYSLGAVDFAAGQSLEEIVRESEEHKGGEANHDGGAERPAVADVPTPPGGSDAGAAGREVPEKRRLSAWAFGVWDADGDLRSGGMFGAADECLQGRAIARHQLPMFVVGPCTEIVHGRETL